MRSNDGENGATSASCNFPHIEDDELSTCAVCGRPHPFPPSKNIPMENVRCDGCWEVEHRLADYLKDGGEKARRFVVETLGSPIKFAAVAFDKNDA